MFAFMYALKSCFRICTYQYSCTFLKEMWKWKVCVDKRRGWNYKNAGSGVLTSALNRWKRKNTIKHRSKGENFKLPHWILHLKGWEQFECFWARFYQISVRACNAGLPESSDVEAHHRTLAWLDTFHLEAFFLVRLVAEHTNNPSNQSTHKWKPVILSLHPRMLLNLLKAF